MELKEMFEELDESNITSLLEHWKKVNVIKKQWNDIEDQFRTKIKIYLKENRWDNYKDNKTKIHVKLTKVKTERFDTEMLKHELSESQISKFMKVSVHERMNIITPELKKNFQKIIKGK